jgi:release factor glutamine methyltransferase
MTTPLDQRPRSGPYSGLTLNSAKRFITQQFRGAELDRPELDARLLVMHALDIDHADMIARGTEFLPPEALDKIRRLADRRLSGQPIDYILGCREFYGRPFKISKDVLSPRPETEGLVDAALQSLRADSALRCLDLGTGSGAIIISLLAERPLWRGAASDISSAALAIAKDNAQTHRIESRLELLQGSWFDAVQGHYDLIISNPPYIDGAHMAALPDEVSNYDPALALSGGPDGLDAYRILAAQSQSYLHAGGRLMLEIGYDQKHTVTELLIREGFKAVACHQDLSGHDRIITARA